MREGLKHRFVEILGASRVDFDAERLAAVSHDATHEGSSEMPALWARPSCDKSLKAVAALCFEEGIPMTPRGAGTGKAGGATPAPLGCVVSFENFRSLDIDVESGTAIAGPGLVLGEFQEQVESTGLFYPPDPASLDQCTLGGTVATNAGGPRAHRYGVTRDYVLGLGLVLADGSATRVGKKTWKGVSGYDLTSLCVGSEGTLGFFSELTLKLVPKPQALATACVSFQDAQSAARFVTQATVLGGWAHALEFIDGVCLRALEEFHQGPLAFAKGAKAALIVECEGPTFDGALAELSRMLVGVPSQSVRVAQDESQRRAIWRARRELSWAVKKLKKKKISEDIAVPRAQLPHFFSLFESLGQKHGLLTCAFGHAGDGNVHAQVLFDSDDQRPTVEALLEDLFALTIELGGTLSGEHGVGIAKKRFMSLEHDALSLSLQGGVKQVFDPRGLMNPGKLF